jgi:hypothetical protein
VTQASFRADSSDPAVVADAFELREATPANFSANHKILNPNGSGLSGV